MPDAMRDAYARRNAERPLHERTNERTYAEAWSPWRDTSPLVTRVKKAIRDFDVETS